MSRGSAQRRTGTALVVLAAWALLVSGCGGKGVEHPQGADGSDSGLAASDSGASSDGPTTTRSGNIIPGPGGFTGRLTGWKRCDGDFECASLTVPQDWDRPDGETIDVAVIRQRSKGEAMGSVLFNPGGPGGSGKEFLVDFAGAGRLPKGLGEKFDLVSWDPRGTGESAPVNCTTDAELEEPDIDPTPDTVEQAAVIAADYGDSLASCERKVGDLLTKVGTRDSARDLDALRYALGDEKLTYVGYSYGTTLGLEYARQFPENVRALVLDGVSIPGKDQVSSTRFQAESFEKNLDAFLADCDARGAKCTFGGGNAKQALMDLIARLETGQRIPANYSFGKLARSGTVGVGELYTALVQAMYERDLWSVLEMGLGQATDPAKPDAGLLLLLRDTYAGRGDDGKWNPIGDANAAINCADTPLRPANAVGDPAVRRQFTQELPLLGGFFASGTPPCSGFPAAEEPLPPATTADFAGVPPVVIVSSTRDPATPYQAGVDAQQLLPGSVLATFDDAVHTAYGRGVKCLDDPVTNYLVRLELPQSGLRCSP